MQTLGREAGKESGCGESPKTWVPATHVNAQLPVLTSCCGHLGSDPADRSSLSVSHIQKKKKKKKHGNILNMSDSGQITKIL